jgi:hypothetical protein
VKGTPIPLRGGGTTARRAVCGTTSEQTASHLELGTKTWRLRHRFAAVFANGICVTVPFHTKEDKK